MCKIIKRLLICALLVVFCWTWDIAADRKKLNDSLIRLHVVANSDETVDQEIKLQVRDAVLKSIQSDLRKIKDIRLAKEYIRDNLSRIQEAANETLIALGVEQRAIATFCQETFNIRHYDTFSLPAGVYDSLRIVIGAGEGRNWWCVAFPSLCFPATTEEFEAVAVNSGLSPKLVDTISNGGRHRLRFFCLEKLGQVQKCLFTGK